MVNSEEGPEATPGQGSGSPPPRPVWVKVFGIVLALIVVAVIVMALTGGDHSPGRHLPDGGEPGGHTPMQHDS